ncbi:MAG: ABC transporter permease [Clostridiales bacterium]|nr:ABC transporter permease [Clostridiales bacterium]
MNRAVVFGKRNIKEIMRSPISWAFGLALPLIIFVIMQAIVKSIGGAAEHVPMFGVDRFTGGVVIFGASFLSLFTALIVSGDRSQSFLARLMSSPMKKLDFIAGYALGVLPISVVQTVVTYIVALCFGLTASVNILPAFLFSLVVALLFVAIGMIMGSLLSAKNAPPLCSVVVQVAALLSGMWFDLDMIGGGFNVFCHVLPFAHAYDLIRYTLAGDYANVWLPALVVLGYTAALSVVAVVVFRRKGYN